MSEDIFVTAARSIFATDVGEDATYQRVAGGDPVPLRVCKGVVLEYVPEILDVQVYIGMTMFEVILADLSPYEPMRGDTITDETKTYTVQAQILNDNVTVQVAVVE